MTARHHHYLSQCYLKGFTQGKAKKSKLTVIDLKEKKRFDTIPRNVGGIRDFNRIDVEGLHQNAVESALADFEGKAAGALKRLDESADFTGETRELILNLLALIAVRSPEKREDMRNIQAQVIDRMLSLSLASKERWEEQEEEKRKDPEYESNFTYEELKEFYDSKEYKIDLTTEHHIRNEMNQVDAILPCLSGRNWTLIKSTDESGPFITTDKPVSLTWDDPETIPAFYRASPGFGMSGTQLYFPVSKDMALLGEFDGEDKVVDGTKKLVAILNTGMLHSVYKQIYSPKISFSFYSKSGDILNGNKIISEFNA